MKFTHAKHKTLEVVGRLTASIEVWNEHLTESDLDLAVRALSREHGLTFLNYHLGPRPYDDASGQGSYRFIFALEDGSMMGATEIGERIDRKLADEVVEQENPLRWGTARSSRSVQCETAVLRGLAC